MHRFKRAHAKHQQHIWIPLADLLFIVVGALILRDIDANRHNQIYRALENASLAEASNDGGVVPSAEDVVKVDASGQVIVRGQRIELSNLRQHLEGGRCVLAVADDARAGDAERVELALRQAKVPYMRLFKRTNPQEQRP